MSAARPLGGERHAPQAAATPGRRAPAGVTLMALMLVAAPAPLDGQRLRVSGPSGYHLELGAAASTPIIEDGNGVSARPGIALTGAAGAAWNVGVRTVLLGSLRASTAPLRLRSMDRRWTAGRAQQLDVALRVEQAVTPGIAIGGGMAVALLHGPDDVVPFRKGGGILFGWGPDVTLAARIPGRRGLHALLGGDAVRITPADRDARIAGGWVGRLRLGVRYAP